MNVYAVDFANKTFNPIAKFDSIASIVNQIIPLVSIVGGLFFLAMAIMAGFTIITGAGEPEKIKKAQSTIVMAIIGLIIVVFAFAFVKILTSILKVDIPL